MTKKSRSRSRVIVKDKIHQYVETETSIGELNAENVGKRLRGNFWSRIDELERICLEILKKKSLPKPSKQVAYRTRLKWIYAEDLENDDNGKYPKIVTGLKFVQEFEETFSDEFYAAKISACCDYIKSNPKLPTEHHLNAIYNIGYDRRDWEFRREQEGVIIAQLDRLETNRNSSPLGGEARSKKYNEAKNKLHQHFFSIKNAASFRRMAKPKRLNALKKFAEEHDRNEIENEPLFRGQVNEPLLSDTWFRTVLKKWKNEGLID